MSNDSREFGVIVLNGVRFPSSIYGSYTNTGTFEGKVVDGDYTRDSDKLMSAKLWTAFAGGIGENRHREGSDEGRVWFHTLNVDNGYSAALATKVESYDEALYPLGDVGGFFYATDDDMNIWKFNVTSKTWADTTVDLSDVPTKAGLLWNGDLYIPQGANGYSYWDGTTATNVADQMVDFVDWDDRLFGVTLGGALQVSTDGTTWTTVAQINTSVVPKSLVTYFDRADNDIIYLVTTAGLYSYNPTTLKFVKTSMRIPAHPDNGMGADVWRPGEDMFITAGLQVYRYTGGSAVPMGPDRGDGLPDELRGRVVDLCSEHNSIMALVEGITQTAPAVLEAEFDAGLGAEDGLEIAQTSVKSAVLAWTGTGWHPRWISPDATGTPNWMYLSAAQNGYRMWWGYGDAIYSIPYSRTFSNTSQLFRTGEGRFERTGYMDLGEVDHNMREFDKLASHIEINMENVTATELVRFFYKKDFDTAFTLLGTTEVPASGLAKGKTIIPFGLGTMEGHPFSFGTVYRTIRPYLEFERGTDESLTPIMDSVVLKYIRLPLSGEVYTFTIPLDFDGEWEGRSAAEIKDELDAILIYPGFVHLHHGYGELTRNHRVRLTRLGGNDRTGLNPIGPRTATFLAVPLAGFDGNG